MHGTCFVKDGGGGFRHSCNLLRWTRVLLSQPVKRNKASGRQQLDYFRSSPLSSQKSAFAAIQEYPVLRAPFPWPCLPSPVFPSFPERRPSFTAFSVSSSEADAELHPGERPRVPAHPPTHPPTYLWVFRNRGRASVACLQHVLQLQREKGFLCSCM